MNRNHATKIGKSDPFRAILIGTHLITQIILLEGIIEVLKDPSPHKQAAFALAFFAFAIMNLAVYEHILRRR